MNGDNEWVQVRVRVGTHARLRNLAISLLKQRPTRYRPLAPNGHLGLDTVIEALIDERDRRRRRSLDHYHKRKAAKKMLDAGPPVS